MPPQRWGSSAGRGGSFPPDTGNPLGVVGVVLLPGRGWVQCHSSTVEQWVQWPRSIRSPQELVGVMPPMPELPGGGPCSAPKHHFSVVELLGHAPSPIRSWLGSLNSAPPRAAGRGVFHVPAGCTTSPLCTTSPSPNWVSGLSLLASRLLNTGPGRVPCVTPWECVLAVPRLALDKRLEGGGEEEPGAD